MDTSDIRAYLFPNGWVDLFSFYPAHAQLNNEGGVCRHHSWLRMLSWIGEDVDFTLFIDYLKDISGDARSVANFTKVEVFLQHPRNQVFFYWFLKASQVNISNPLLGEFAGRHHWNKFRQWAKEESMDDVTLSFVRKWHHLPELASVLTYKGVPLGVGMEYELMGEILEKYFSAFARDTQ